MNWYKVAKESVILQWITTMIMHGQISRTIIPGTKYRTPDQFFKEHGKFFVSQALTPEEKVIVWPAIQKPSRYKMKECFYNSQVISQRYGLKYVEGYCFSGLIPVQHAWNAINGKVIDVTLKKSNGGKVIAGIIPDGWEYFGVDFPIEEIGRIWREYQMSLPVISWETRYDWLRRNHPGDPDSEQDDEDVKRMRELIEEK